MSKENKITVKLLDDLELSIKNKTNAYSENSSIIFRYASDLGGTIIDNNTFSFFSKEPFIEFINKLLEF